MRTQSICLALAIVLICPLAYAQWIHTTETHPVRCLAVNGTNLFAGTEQHGVLLSTNNGVTWTAVNEGLMDTSVYALAVSGTNVFAGTQGNGFGSGGVFLSTNNGTSWTATSLVGTQVWSLAVSGTNLFAGILGYLGAGVFLSTDNGTSWTQAGIPFSQFSQMVAIGPNLFAGTRRGVYHSTNAGTSWTLDTVGMGSRDLTSFAIYGTNVFAGTYGHIFLSTDNGASWTGVDSKLGQPGRTALAVKSNNLFVGSWIEMGCRGEPCPQGVFLTKDSGISWTAVNEGLTDISVMTFAIMGTELFAGTYNSGVWRRPLSEMITTVDLAMSELPSEFTLAQNYPNPFNPSTTITYELPKTSLVNLSVFNMLGMQVAILVNAEKPAGVHMVQFNGSGLASGVYFYRLETAGFVQTKKLVLVK